MPYRFEFHRVNRILRAPVEGVIGDEEISEFRAKLAQAESLLLPSSRLGSNPPIAVTSALADALRTAR